MMHRFPEGLSGEKVHQKRLPHGAPPWVETVRVHFPVRPARRRAVRHRAGQRDLGGADVHRRVPPVELPPGRHRAPGRVADRPRPDARSATSTRVRRVAHVAHEVLDELGAVGWPKTSGGKGLHIYVRIEPRWGFADVRRAALAFAREVERRAPDDVTTTWWRKDRDPRAAVRRLQPERPRPHHRQRLLGARRAGGDGVDADPLGRDRRRRCRGDFTIATVPARFAELGDLHAGIDDAVFSPRHPAGVGRARRARGRRRPGRTRRRHGRPTGGMTSSGHPPPPRTRTRTRTRTLNRGAAPFPG